MINYDQASKTYDNTRTKSARVLEALAKIARLNSESVILDFGCGTGNYLDSLHRQFRCQCFGVEPSEGMRAAARQKNSSLLIQEGNHAQLPFENAFFDFIYMTDVIHHIPDLQTLFKTLHRVVKKDGVICIATESHEQIQARFYNRYFPSLADNEKQRYPDINVILSSAILVGFTRIQIETISAPEENTISKRFLQNVEEKNYSMFRLLDNEEFNQGLAALKKDEGCIIQCPNAGDTVITLKQ